MVRYNYITVIVIVQFSIIFSRFYRLNAANHSTKWDTCIKMVLILNNCYTMIYTVCRLCLSMIYMPRWLHDKVTAWQDNFQRYLSMKNSKKKWLKILNTWIWRTISQYDKHTESETILAELFTYITMNKCTDYIVCQSMILSVIKMHTNIIIIIVKSNFLFSTVLVIFV